MSLADNNDDWLTLDDVGGAACEAEATVLVVKSVGTIGASVVILCRCDVTAERATEAIAARPPGGFRMMMGSLCGSTPVRHRKRIGPERDWTLEMVMGGRCAVDTPDCKCCGRMGRSGIVWTTCNCCGLSLLRTRTLSGFCSLRLTACPACCVTPCGRIRRNEFVTATFAVKLII